MDLKTLEIYSHVFQNKTWNSEILSTKKKKFDINFFKNVDYLNYKIENKPIGLKLCDLNEVS